MRFSPLAGETACMSTPLLQPYSFVVYRVLQSNAKFRGNLRLNSMVLLQNIGKGFEVFAILGGGIRQSIVPFHVNPSLIHRLV